MDEIDVTLLRTLAENADVTATELMRSANLSIPAINKRIARLKSSGMIRKVTVLTDAKMVGKPIVAFVLVVLDRFSNMAACVNSAAQFGAIAALEGPQEPLHQMQKTYAERRKIIVEGFRQIKGLKCFAPQGAFYAFVDISETGLNAEEFALQLLEQARVIVVPGHAFGEDSCCYVRLSFATSEENIREGLRRIAGFMQQRK